MGVSSSFTALGAEQRAGAELSAAVVPAKCGQRYPPVTIGDTVTEKPLELAFSVPVILLLTFANTINVLCSLLYD